jgi:hypothetical protein
MPSMYSEGEYALAGFSVGVVLPRRTDKGSGALPHMAEVAPRYVLLALPSAGVHANGFSLVRKAGHGQRLHAEALFFTDVDARGPAAWAVARRRAARSDTRLRTPAAACAARRRRRGAAAGKIRTASRAAAVPRGVQALPQRVTGISWSHAARGPW